MKSDLHIHTTESDGCLSVEEILLIASQRDLKILSITDHETTLGVEKAKKCAVPYGISIIPGVEFNTIYRDQEIHLLGYYKDINNDCLQNRLLRIRKDRTEITMKMVERLQQNGFPVEWDMVEEKASKQGIVCKTHILYSIWNKACEDKNINWNDVASCFRPGGVAYIPYQGNPYKEAVDFIFATGGIPVLAHPGLIKNKALIKELLAYRQIGLEVYYGYWEQAGEMINYFELLAKNSALLSTGGSDYHGFYSPVDIGQVKVPDRCAEELKFYLQIQ